MNYVNLTAHSIDLVPLGITIPHTNRPVKVDQRSKLLNEGDTIPIYEIEYLDIAGLPEPKEDTVYIVSAPVLNYVHQKLPDRKDFVSPFGQIKDARGHTVGCTSFRTNG